MRTMLVAAGLALALASRQARADPATTPDQISSPAGSTTGASQIAPASRADVGAAGQISVVAPRADAPEQAAARTLDTTAAPIKGTDRCDPAAGHAQRPECAHIVDSRADELAPAPKAPPTATVSPDASSDALVNGIVGGGTGGVAQLPK
jgi:hypothetical protein